VSNGDHPHWDDEGGAPTRPVDTEIRTPSEARRLEARQATPLRSGTRVDKFHVLRCLGRGGMGEVYLARDTGLGRMVALKV